MIDLLLTWNDVEMLCTFDVTPFSPGTYDRNGLCITPPSDMEVDLDDAKIGDVSVYPLLSIDALYDLRQKAYYILSSDGEIDDDGQ